MLSWHPYEPRAHSLPRRAIVYAHTHISDSPAPATAQDEEEALEAPNRFQDRKQRKVQLDMSVNVTCGDYGGSAEWVILN